ncbi:MAG: hypothetical protein U5N58_12720 [Actinomycetota bacterium]|nr:hypothetical protein [Actinomycetota bacterium]
MPLKLRYRNPLVLSIVSTIFLVPIMILAMFLFDHVHWGMLAVTVVN